MRAHVRPGLLLAPRLLGAELRAEEWQRISIDATVKSLALQVEGLFFSETANFVGNLLLE
jgi:hypothetical protein